MARAVFLDRDGVLNVPEIRNGLPHPPRNVADFRLYPEAKEGCRLLHEAGFLLVVVTNQPDVGRGTQSPETIEQMNAVLGRELPIDRIETCFAADDEALDADRRKPEPGMVLDAARALEIDVPRSYLVGDRWRDVDCGHAAGCITIFIERGYAEKLRRPPHHYAANLLDAAQLILRLEQARSEARAGPPTASE
jgi:D-glycero-D-manno-heptose 1,7-bisphosphate phosphatase